MNHLLIRNKLAQRVAGAVIVVVSLALVVYGWGHAAEHGRILKLWLFLPPAFAVIGCGLALFPLDVQRLQQEHGVDRVSAWAHLPTPWRVIVVLMFAAALANSYFVTGRFA